MPYINSGIRHNLDPEPITKARKPGELNYQMSQLVRSYIAMHGPSLHYKTFNDIIGVLECLKMEVYRKLTAPYEDEKERENGSVW